MYYQNVFFLLWSVYLHLFHFEFQTLYYKCEQYIIKNAYVLTHVAGDQHIIVDPFHICIQTYICYITNSIPNTNFTWGLGYLIISEMICFNISNVSISFTTYELLNFHILCILTHFCMSLLVTLLTFKVWRLYILFCCLKIELVNDAQVFIIVQHLTYSNIKANFLILFG